MGEPVSLGVLSERVVDPLETLCSRLLRISATSEIDVDISAAMRELDARALLNQFPDFIYVKDRNSRFIFANDATGRDSSLDQEGDLVGKSAIDVFSPETARGIFISEQELMTTGIAIKEREHKITLVDGRSLWLMTTKTPLRDAAGNIIGLIGISRDVTERKRQEDLRRGHARVLEMIARGNPLQTVLEALVLLAEAELVGMMGSVLLLEEGTDCLRNVAAPNLPEAYLTLIEGVEIGPKLGSCGTAAWRRSQVIVSDIMTDPLWEDFLDIAIAFRLGSCWSTPIMGSDGRVLGTFALYSSGPRVPTQMEMELIRMATDLAGIAIERSLTEERIRHLAHHDPLTGLPNRTLFWSQFTRTLHEARREARKVTVAYVDLDNFKCINDSRGHAAGDEVLKTIAARMANCVRASDLLVRLGGDEFAIVFSNPGTGSDGIVRRLHELRSAISRAVLVDGESLSATCSMGVAFFPEDGDTPEELLARADQAMYEAKDMGRDTLRVSGKPAGDIAGMDGMGI